MPSESTTRRHWIWTLLIALGIAVAVLAAAYWYRGYRLHQEHRKNLEADSPALPGRP